MNSVRWSVRASKDLERIYRWIAADDPTAAANQIGLLIRSIQQLALFPESGHKSNIHGNRELAVPRTPYILRYRRVQDTVLLIRIKHGAQQQ